MLKKIIKYLEEIRYWFATQKSPPMMLWVTHPSFCEQLISLEPSGHKCTPLSPNAAKGSEQEWGLYLWPDGTRLYIYFPGCLIIFYFLYIQKWDFAIFAGAWTLLFPFILYSIARKPLFNKSFWDKWPPHLYTYFDGIPQFRTFHPNAFQLFFEMLWGLRHSKSKISWYSFGSKEESFLRAALTDFFSSEPNQTGLRRYQGYIKLIVYFFSPVWCWLLFCLILYAPVVDLELSRQQACFPIVVWAISSVCFTYWQGNSFSRYAEFRQKDLEYLPVHLQNKFNHYTDLSNLLPNIKIITIINSILTGILATYLTLLSNLG